MTRYVCGMQPAQAPSILLDHTFLSTLDFVDTALGTSRGSADADQVKRNQWKSNV